MADQGISFWQYYQPDQPLNVMVIGATDCQPDYAVERKNSNITALEYISEGSGMLEINGKHYQPEKGCAILLTKGSDHRYATDAGRRWKKRWIVCDGPLVEQLARLYLPEGEYCFPGCRLGPYFEQIDRLAALYRGDYSKLMDQLAPLLLDMILCIKNAAARTQYDLAELLRQSLDMRLGEKLSLCALATDFSYSKNHIIRVFKEKFGLTPYQYFIDRKITVAKLYLSNTNYSVTEIAAALAFTDEHHFSNCFRSAVGCSPSQYRKNAGHGAGSLSL